MGDGDRESEIWNLESEISSHCGPEPLAPSPFFI